jgi:histidinol-phosphatase (PHP family)
MYVDSHVHLQPHGQQPPMTRERIELYVEAGRANGVERIAITEHLFRFREAYEQLHGWWDADPNAELSRTTRQYWEDHVSGSIADYVRVVEEAKSAGLPVLLGIELDWLTGRAEALDSILRPYDWDIVLGSVHWIGAWGFDTGLPAYAAEWEVRTVDDVFEAYGSLLRELAASGLCDVLAHPDLPKLWGNRPRSFDPLHVAIVEAADAGGCAVEMNSNGWRTPNAEAYPALPVLERARVAGLPITLASDAHTPDRAGQRFDDLASLARKAGYAEYVSFEQRRASAHALPVLGAK